MIRFTFKNNSGRKTEDEDERESRNRETNKGYSFPVWIWNIKDLYQAGRIM